MKNRLISMFLIILHLLFITCIAYGEQTGTWKCPNCKAENTGNFCTNCGEKKPGTDTWTCPQCGSENTGNFCSNCGQKKPNGETEASKVSSISDISCSADKDNGIVISWKDSGNNGPYTIQYVGENWPEETINAVDSTHQKKATIHFLIPGVQYTFTISDSVGSATTTYKVPKSAFTEFQTGGKWLRLTKDDFSQASLVKNPNVSMQLRTFYPPLKKDRDYPAKLCLKTPLGYSYYVTEWGSFTLENQYSYIYTPISLSDDIVNPVIEQYGYIPKGTYTYEMYFDNHLYDYVDFYIGD